MRRTAQPPDLDLGTQVSVTRSTAAESGERWCTQNKTQLLVHNYAKHQCPPSGAELAELDIVPSGSREMPRCKLGRALPLPPRNWSARWERQREVAGDDLRQRLHAEGRQPRDRLDNDLPVSEDKPAPLPHRVLDAFADQSRSRLASQASACGAPRSRELTPTCRSASPTSNIRQCRVRRVAFLRSMYLCNRTCLQGSQNGRSVPDPDSCAAANQTGVADLMPHSPQPPRAATESASSWYCLRRSNDLAVPIDSVLPRA